MTILAVLTVGAVLESTLPSTCLSYKIQHNEAAVAVFTVLAASAVVAVSVMTAAPLKLNPPFCDSDRLVAERGFCASEYWGLTRVCVCVCVCVCVSEAHGKLQESVSIS